MLERSDMGAEVNLAVADAEFSANIFPVERNGFGADAEFSCDFLRAFAPRDKTGDFDFCRSQRIGICLQAGVAVCFEIVDICIDGLEAGQYAGSGVMF